MIRLIASDLDGTLLQKGTQSLSPDVISFIEQLFTEYGIIFVAASGRQYPNLKRLFGSASKYMAFICENGALTFYQDKLLLGKTMDRETALSISHDILSLPNCEVLMSGQQTSYIMPKTESYYHYIANHVKNNTVVIARPEDQPEDIYKVSVYEKSGVATGHGPELMAKYQDNTSCSISGYAWLDFVAPNVNKGTAMTALMNHLSLDASECVAFGDNYNDLEMLSIVKYGYVMNTAVREIKAQFSYFCDNVIETIQHLLQIK